MVSRGLEGEEEMRRVQELEALMSEESGAASELDSVAVVGN